MSKGIGFLCLAVVSLLSLNGCKGKVSEFAPLPKGFTVTQYDGMNLVWHDEFDIDGRPGADWSYEKGFVRNQEHQWYQEDNCFVEGGALVIEARRETVPNPDYSPEASPRDWKRSREYAGYTSGSINTRRSFTFKYGKLEVRAKISTEKGSWPAIWLLGNQWGWPYGGEIDVMEYYLYRDTPTILANVAWGNERGGAEWRSSYHPLARFLEKDPQWVEKFHIWTMDWTPGEIVLSLDGEVLNRVDLSETVNGGFRGNTENPFNNTYEDFADYILLNYAIGGQNGGDPDGSEWPQRYYVDYVRVYQ
ncbi:MAG: glycoside hydrolase family 16 protein [Bacteroidales bacterium]|nr:glycoside hydrolase family 16 protein [Bacteroidales bacterium]